jgi:hypothetical protein
MISSEEVGPFSDYKTFIVDNSNTLGTPVYAYNGQLYCDGGGSVSSYESLYDYLDIEDGTIGSKVYVINHKLYVDKDSAPMILQTRGGREVLVMSVPDNEGLDSTTLVTYANNEFLQTNETSFSTVRTHYHTIFKHDHGIEYGIYEEGGSPLVGVLTDDGNGYTYRFSSSSDILDYDLTPYFTGTGWKGISFTANQRCRVVYSIQLKLDIEA